MFYTTPQTHMGPHSQAYVLGSQPRNPCRDTHQTCFTHTENPPRLKKLSHCPFPTRLVLPLRQPFEGTGLRKGQTDNLLNGGT